MKKIIGNEFANKCRELLKIEGANMYSVARKLKCSYSTVYRATGGKKRAGEPKKATAEWAETTRRSRTKTGQARNVGLSKEAMRKARGTGVRGVPRNRAVQQAGNTRRSEKHKRVQAKRAALRAS